MKREANDVMFLYIGVDLYPLVVIIIISFLLLFDRARQTHTGRPISILGRICLAGPLKVRLKRLSK